MFRLIASLCSQLLALTTQITLTLDLSHRKRNVCPACCGVLSPVVQHKRGWLIRVDARGSTQAYQADIIESTVTFPKDPESSIVNNVRIDPAEVALFKWSDRSFFDVVYLAVLSGIDRHMELGAGCTILVFEHVLREIVRLSGESKAE